MEIVILTALGVGASTVLGALVGFLFGKSMQKLGDVILAFGAGVMLCASMLGLILPSIEYGGAMAPLVTALGVISGALLIMITRMAAPHIEAMISGYKESIGDPCHKKRKRSVIILVLAIAIHNLPEGIAAGVGFGTENVTDAVLIAVAIALQNIPEGMALIPPMLSVGIPRSRAFLCAALTGVIEVIGTFVGYFAVEISAALLPFALSFAGGCMIEVVCDEMIPDIHSSQKNGAAVGMSLILGFIFMVMFDFWI